MQLNKKSKQNIIQKFRSWKHYHTFSIAVMSALITYAFTIWVITIARASTPVEHFILIVLCLISSFLLGNDFIILLGELFTIGADVFLMLCKEPTRNIGFIIFFVAQVCYGVYFYLFDKNKIRKNVLLGFRLLLTIMTPIIFKILIKNDFNFIVCFIAMYAAGLFSNLLCVCFTKNWILLAGFILFSLCDITIALNAIVPSDSGFKHFLQLVNWTYVFYIPSQPLIAFNKKKLDLKINQII